MTTEGSPVDFYAASLAATAVVLFAKFMTHRGHGRAGTPPWNRLHRACVGTAWTGFVVSLVVLGNLPSGGLEVTLRWTVGLLVVIAATILALDVDRLEWGPSLVWRCQASRSTQPAIAPNHETRDCIGREQ